MPLRYDLPDYCRNRVLRRPTLSGNGELNRRRWWQAIELLGPRRVTARWTFFVGRNFSLPLALS